MFLSAIHTSFLVKCLQTNQICQKYLKEKVFQLKEHPFSSPIFSMGCDLAQAIIWAKGTSSCSSTKKWVFYVCQSGRTDLTSGSPRCRDQLWEPAPGSPHHGCLPWDVSVESVSPQNVWMRNKGVLGKRLGLGLTHPQLCFMFKDIKEWSPPWCTTNCIIRASRNCQGPE